MSRLQDGGAGMLGQTGDPSKSQGVQDYGEPAEEGLTILQYSTNI